jgi:hypothetical protein
MAATSPCSSTSSDISSAYEAAMAKRSQDQTKVQGASALRLIQDSSVPPPSPQPLPPDATISVRA